MVLQTLTTAQVHCQALEYLLPKIQISELSKEAVPTTQCENSMKNLLSQKPFQMKQVKNKPFLLLMKVLDKIYINVSILKIWPYVSH